MIISYEIKICDKEAWTHSVCADRAMTSRTRRTSRVGGCMILANRRCWLSCDFSHSVQSVPHSFRPHCVFAIFSARKHTGTRERPASSILPASHSTHSLAGKSKNTPCSALCCCWRRLTATHGSTNRCLQRENKVSRFIH